ncbi:TRAP transporter small permease [Bacillus sp. FJAT-45350]|uniref:TRAP transporter small permease n=1 Tax=Bacillus sp. FJAT-45350 TaxID=2011014 RepID=UPI000BB8149F|nr:TRAP transporter small permease [Bacillus sp. FJAT-45350]
MKSIFFKIEKIHEVLKLIGVYISGISILGMMLLIVTDVFLRNVFTAPISGTYELVQFYFMPLAIFPALAYTYSSGILPRLGELIEKAPFRVQNTVTYILLFIEIVIFGLLMVYGWKFAMSGLSDKMAIPIGGSLLIHYPIYFLVPIGFGLVLVEVIITSCKRILKINDEGSVPQ